MVPGKGDDRARRVEYQNYHWDIFAYIACTSIESIVSGSCVCVLGSAPTLRKKMDEIASTNILFSYRFAKHQKTKSCPTTRSPTRTLNQLFFKSQGDEDQVSEVSEEKLRKVRSCVK